MKNCIYCLREIHTTRTIHRTEMCDACYKLSPRQRKLQFISPIINSMVTQRIQNQEFQVHTILSVPVVERVAFLRTVTGPNAFYVMLKQVSEAEISATYGVIRELVNHEIKKHHKQITYCVHVDREMLFVLKQGVFMKKSEAESAVKEYIESVLGLLVDVTIALAERNGEIMGISMTVCAKGYMVGIHSYAYIGFEYEQGVNAFGIGGEKMSWCTNPFYVSDDFKVAFRVVGEIVLGHHHTLIQTIEDIVKQIDWTKE